MNSFNISNNSNGLVSLEDGERKGDSVISTVDSTVTESRSRIYDASILPQFLVS